ncbi:MAG: hypothetical protein HY710_08915 [Candidatus Latescibacteria bacterium]|nr:hypothetical protein [Candidatus Latescibacterota bacterium]
MPDSARTPDRSSLVTRHSSLTDSASHQSLRKAVFLSLLVPGLGEGYAGDWGRARVFFVAEAAAWTGFTVFRVFGRWRTNDARVYAAEHASVSLGGKPDSYFRIIGSYPSNAVYNEEQQLTQREHARLYTGDAAWTWDSAAARKMYLSIRRSSERARVRSGYLVGLAIVNRLASAVDAVKAMNVRGRKGEQGLLFDLIVPSDGSVWVVARVRLE